MIERLLALGPSRALIADLEAGQLQNGEPAITIDPALLDQIKLVEGEFTEKEGAPAFKVVGDVTANGKAVSPAKIVRSR